MKIKCLCDFWYFLLFSLFCAGRVKLLMSLVPEKLLEILFNCFYIINCSHLKRNLKSLQGTKVFSNFKCPAQKSEKSKNSQKACIYHKNKRNSLHFNPNFFCFHWDSNLVFLSLKSCYSPKKLKSLRLFVRPSASLTPL